MDRPKRGGEGEEGEVVEEEAASGGAGMYSTVALRFGCMGGGRSVVGREDDEERE